MFWNQQWMEGAGRFYPVHWIESRFIFSYLQDINAYKTLQFVVLFLAGVLFAYIGYLFSNSHSISILILALLPVTTQFRRDFDPHLAFASMVPSMLIKIFLAVILILFSNNTKSRLKSMFFTVFAALLYFAAMSTYEFAFLLFPCLVLALLAHIDLSTSNLKSIFTRLLRDCRLYILGSAWFAYGILVFGYLRPKALEISGTYELGFSIDSIPVFLSQVFVGLPGITFRANDIEIWNFSFQYIVLFGWFCFFIFRFLIFSLANDLIRRSEKRNSGKKLRRNSNVNESSSISFDLRLFLFALVFVFTPGLMMSLQPAWWNRADLAHSYLGVLLTEFGTALMIAMAIYHFLSKQLKDSKRQML